MDSSVIVMWLHNTVYSSHGLQCDCHITSVVCISGWMVLWWDCLSHDSHCSKLMVSDHVTVMCLSHDSSLTCSPDAQGFLQKLEREERQKRDGVDNRSFLQKYVSLLEVHGHSFSLLVIFVTLAHAPSHSPPPPPPPPPPHTHTHTHHHTNTPAQWLYIVLGILVFTMLQGGGGGGGGGGQ